jgi:hypothetical protein
MPFQPSIYELVLPDFGKEFHLHDEIDAKRRR